MARRLELKSGLQGETLVRRHMKRRVRPGDQIRLLPELSVIKIGGHAAVDYGRDVMFPLMEEIGELSRKHQLLVVT
ncbi:MAG: uridylate kinase, partial [Methanomicrobiales archaeon]|nr:uridylate kinase [Methanomicrobiales archaeon]